MGARSIFENDCYCVEADAEAQLVTLTRRRRPFVSAQDAEGACAPVNAALDALRRAQHRLLVDSREAAPRNDAAYEDWFAPHRKSLLSGFARTAVLVKSAVGVLQSRRLVQQDRGDAKIFTDPESAIAYLMACSLPGGANGAPRHAR